MAKPNPSLPATDPRHDTPPAHSCASSLREQALSHLLLWQLIAARWRAGCYDIDVLKSEVDRGGYDIVLESGGIIRHVQLKSSITASSVREVSVSTRLLEKPSGCVIWLEVDRTTLEIERYLWFGAKPGSRLPELGSRISKHSRANSAGVKAERPLHRLLSKSCFDVVNNAEELVLRLFG